MEILQWYYVIDDRLCINKDTGFMSYFLKIASYRASDKYFAYFSSFYFRLCIFSCSDRYQNHNNMSNPTRQMDGPMFVRPGGTMQRENGAVSGGWNGPVSNRELVTMYQVSLYDALML